MLAFPAQKELIAQVFVAWRYVLGLLGFVIYYMLPIRKMNATGSRTEKSCFRGDVFSENTGFEQ